MRIADRNVVSVLYRHGFLAAPSVEEALTVPQPVVEQALSDYQEWHGIDQSGEVCAVTLASMAKPRPCAHPDKMLVGVPMWPKSNLAYWIDPVAKFGVLDRADVEGIFVDVWETWAQVCGIQGRMVRDLQSADILISTATIDGPWGLLAQTDMPDNNPLANTIQRKQVFDSAEAWSDEVGKFFITLSGVALHETGHAIGLGHGPTGNVMEPLYDPGMVKLQAWDIDQAVMRYPKRS